MSGDGFSILIFGDESAETEKVCAILRCCTVQANLSACYNLEEALRKIENDQIDIVFLDAGRLNGGLREVIARLRSRGCDAPSVVALAARDSEHGKALLDAGACEYLPAGAVDPATLPVVLRSLLERRALSKALAFSEERYARLLQSVTDYTYTVAVREHRPVSTSHSPGCYAVTGYTPAEYAADPQLWFRMIHDADRPAVLRMVSQVLSGGTVGPLEHRIVHKTGSIRWIRNTPMPRYDPQGLLVAYDGLVTDITDRKQAELALRESEARYRTLVDTTPDGIFLVDRDVRFLFANNTGAQMLGMRREELIGRTYGDLFPAEAREGHEEIVRRVITRGEPLETDLLHFAGRREIWTFARLVPLFDENNTVTSVLCVVVDITERKSAEAALRESEQRLQREFLNVQRAKQEWELTFDALRDPLFIHDRDCRIIRANRAYREAAGVSFGELIGKPFFTLFPRLDDADADQWRELQAQAGRSPYFVKDFDVPQLKRMFRGRAYPVLDDEGALLYAIQVLEDVTETRQEMEISANLLALAEASTETMDMDRLQERISACCGRILSADVVLTYFLDSRTGMITPQQAWGLRRELLPTFKTAPLDTSSPLVRTATLSRRPLAAVRECEAAGEGEWFRLETIGQTGETRAYNTASRPLPWLEDVATFLAVPLVSQAEELGLLMACFRSPRAFTERDRMIVEGISRQVSLALHEAHLYRMAMERSMVLAHKMETLKVIHEIDLSILSSLKPAEILETAVRNVSRIVACERAEAMLLDRKTRAFSRIRGQAAGAAGRSPEIVPASDTLANEVIADCRPRSVADLREAAGLPPEEQRLLRDDLRSLIMLPLIVKGEAVGVLSAASRRPAAFTPENLETLEQLADQIGVAIDNTRMYADLEELFLGTVKSLSFAIDAKSSWTAGHSERVTRYAQLMGKELGYSDRALRDLELAGLLHDVGKLGTFDAILDKKSALDDEEFVVIKRHPAHGAEMLKPIRQMERIIPAVRHHHERYDGSGYPDGLKGADIPELARLLAVADAFDSMTGWRPYRKTFSQTEAIEELHRCAGTQFDPRFVDAFVNGLAKQGRDYQSLAA